MHPIKGYVQEIQKALQKAPKKDYEYFDNNRYHGSQTTFLGLATKDKRAVAKLFKKNHPQVPFKELISLMDELYTSTVYEEKTLAPELLMQYKHYIPLVTPTHLEKWLKRSQGWAEIDTLCQSTFEPIFFLSDWNTWKDALTEFSKSSFIQLRRASLVLLCRSVRKSDDKRLADRALANVDQVKGEKDILITKAVSWILREMVKLHRKRVVDYMERNKDLLPKIAVREVTRKLQTGKK
ncbi:DNA alkylation repair protein [Candidatus Woesebacteria bacterium]|nr:DNA alkylation repair protein [Candidatus Woesebacteria bacterium]